QHQVENALATACAPGYAAALVPGLSPSYMARSAISKTDSPLAGIAILARLSPRALNTLQQRCAFRHYEPGESIVDYLDQSDEVFFIISGQVSVTIYSLAGQVVSFREL